MHNRTGNSTQGHLTLTFPCQPPEAPSALRRKIATMVPCLFVMVVAAGCASTTVTDRQPFVTGQLPRSNQIWVYDFAATAADVPADSSLAGQYSAGATPQTAQQIAAGRQLGATIATQLVAQSRGMGLPAAPAVAGTTPRINDMVIRGSLLSVKEGSAAERVAIGFGSGASELRTAVEGYQITAQGLRELGAGTVESGGSKAPGADLGFAGLIATGNPAGLIISTGMKAYGEESGSSTVEGRAKQTAKEIAEVLKKRFEQQGWIQ
jgi:hypothetical protein